jgi:hypothetical protein
MHALETIILRNTRAVGRELYQLYQSAANAKLGNIIAVVNREAPSDWPEVDRGWVDAAPAPWTFEPRVPTQVEVPYDGGPIHNLDVVPKDCHVCRGDA